MTHFVASVTEDEARNIIKSTDRETAILAAMRYGNVTEADVDDDGDVWVSNPCTGHWLNSDQLCQLAEGIEAEAMIAPK